MIKIAAMKLEGETEASDDPLSDSYLSRISFVSSEGMFLFLYFRSGSSEASIHHASARRAPLIATQKIRNTGNYK